MINPRLLCLQAFAWVIFSYPTPASAAPPLPAISTPIERIALGSCADQERPQRIWPAIAETEPQVFLFLGDNVYADTYDMAEMRSAYETLAAVPEFAAFRERVPILATWDDHDFGWNDAGAEYPHKASTKTLMLDFFGVPADDASRQRPGVYQAKIFGPPGQRLQIILLDGRWFRSELIEDPSPYRRYEPDLDPASTLLGEAQWRWLRKQLEQPAELRLIASGIQVLGYAAGFESWKNMPLEQERLFDLIRDARAAGVVLLSGDAHFTQIKRGDGGIGYPLYEFTSSGLTHGNPAGAARPSPLSLHRPYGGLNFGLIEVRWQGDPSVKLSARDIRGTVVFEHTIRLAELQPPTEIID
ncbi:MAG: alkaline phosphatase D family protein [Acidobacteriota bacterium]